MAAANVLAVWPLGKLWRLFSNCQTIESRHVRASKGGLRCFDLLCIPGASRWVEPICGVIGHVVGQRHIGFAHIHKMRSKSPNVLLQDNADKRATITLFSEYNITLDDRV
jgi:hypothetical protein